MADLKKRRAAPLAGSTCWVTCPKLTVGLVVLSQWPASGYKLRTCTTGWKLPSVRPQTRSV